MAVSNRPPAEDPGDRAFLEQLYERFQRLMYYVAGKYISDPAARGDAVQDALVCLVEKAALLRQLEDTALAAYIVAAVRNAAFSLLRRQGRTGLRTISMEESAGAAPIPAREEPILAAEERILAGQVLERLPPEDRILLEGRYLLELTDAELAQRLGCQPGSVRMKLTRARRRALKQLTEPKKEDIPS